MSIDGQRVYELHTLHNAFVSGMDREVDFLESCTRVYCSRSISGWGQGENKEWDARIEAGKTYSGNEPYCVINILLLNYPCSAVISVRRDLRPVNECGKAIHCLGRRSSCSC